MKRKRQPDRERVELMARGVARGKTIREAATLAGYSPRSKWIYHISVRPEFQARVAALERETPLTDGDMAPVLLALMDGAHAALAEKTGPAWAAAARMLAEAARIKKDLPDIKQQDLEMAWALKWAPRTEQASLLSSPTGGG